MCIKIYLCMRITNYIYLTSEGWYEISVILKDVTANADKIIDSIK